MGPRTVEPLTAMIREAERVVQLSVGRHEKQRLALARALYKEAEVVLVDEPTASRDSENRHRMVDLLVPVAGQGKTLVIATHDEVVAGAADQVYDVRRRSFSTDGVFPVAVGPSPA